MKERLEKDIVILGGGIAGMTAAIYAARANHSCAILEQSITGGLANSTYTVENFPSHKNIHGMRLMQDIRDQVDSYDIPVEEVCEIEDISLETQPKIIETSEAVYVAKTVIIATGRKPIPLETPTECERVHHCAICDGAAYKGKRVLVVGGGNSAFDEALYLTQLGVGHITIVEKEDRFFAAQATQDSLLSMPGVAAYTRHRVVDLVVDGDALTGVILEDLNTGVQRTEPMDGVFVFLGQSPNSELFAENIRLDESGYVLADADMQTNIPGVFSAGDINVKRFRQLTTAAADGTIAALMADRFLRTQGKG
jgi:Thioredoxin reductase